MITNGNRVTQYVSKRPRPDDIEEFNNTSVATVCPQAICEEFGIVPFTATLVNGVLTITRTPGSEAAWEKRSETITVMVAGSFNGTYEGASSVDICDHKTNTALFSIEIHPGANRVETVF